MDQEASPVPDEELVLRRIHKNHVDPGPPPVIGLAAFRPTPEDTAGLSVYREKHVSPAVSRKAHDPAATAPAAAPAASSDIKTMRYQPSTVSKERSGTEAALDSNFTS